MSTRASNKRARTAKGSTASSSAPVVMTEAALEQHVDSLPLAQLPALLRKLLVSHPDTHATFRSLREEALQQEKERKRLLPPADFSDLVRECEYELDMKHAQLRPSLRDAKGEEVIGVIYGARDKIKDACRSDENLQTQINGIRALVSIEQATRGCRFDEIAAYFDDDEQDDDDFPGTIVQIFNRMVVAHKDEQPGSAALKSIKQLSVELSLADLDDRLEDLA